MKRLFAFALAIALNFAPCSATHAFNEGQGSLKITPLLKTTTTWEGAPIRYPEGKPQITGLMVEIPPGGETGWHSHPVPSFGYILEGTLDVTLKDGRVMRMNAGEAIAEVIDTIHNGRVVGTQAVKLIVFYAGVVDGALTTPAQ